MKFKDCQYSKKRRGLSTIVGALLFLVLMVATFSVLGIALNSQTEIASTSRDIADIDLKQQQEAFGIALSTDDTQILAVDVTNSGQNPTEIFTVVLTNRTDIGFPTKTYPIPSDTSFIAPGDFKDVVSTLNMNMTLAAAAGLKEIYDFKIISSLGTIKTATLECSFTECGAVSIGGDLIIQLFADGPTGVNTKISTIIMFVTNTADFTYTDVQPTRGFTDTPTTCNVPDLLPPFDPFWKVLIFGTPDDFTENIAPCDFDAFSPVDLGPSQTTLFKWDATLTGDIDTVFEFCNGVQGNDDLGDPQTFGPECDTLTIIDPNDCGGCGPGGEGGETIILIDDLLIRPSIFMIIPSPFGATLKTAQFTGLWGINVANPTDEPMTISKVTIVAYPPGGQSQDNVISGKDDDCLQDDIAPNTGPQPFGFWNCPRDNIMMWQNFTHPLLLKANSTESFMLRVEPSGIKPGGEPANLDALIVQANVYSTFGSFGKAGYQSSMYLEKSPIVNVYLTDTIDSRTSFIGSINDITVNSTETFKVVLADLDDEGTTFINIGARLIINVPREWKFVDFLTTTGFITNATQPSVVEHSDGSTQIIAITTEEIGKAGQPDARTIEFRATAPDVKAPRLYVMYILADGIITDPTPEDKTIGPLMEAVLNVDP